METTPIKQLLKSLCTSSPWSYAVFWKLQQQSPMLLTFEDGYFDYLESQHFCLSITGDGHPGQKDVINLIPGTKVLGSEFNGCPLGFEPDDMPCRQYELGEGLVGGVALSGDDLWVYSDDIGSNELISNPQYSDEWLPPMKAGIKTTLLAPILPHGVLQLGSMEKVAKNLAMVAEFKGKFTALHSTVFTTSFASDVNSLLFSSTLIPELDKDDSFLSSSSLHKRMASEYPEDLCAARIGNQDMLPATIGKCLQPDDVTSIAPFAIDQAIPYLHPGLDIQPNTLNQFVIADVTKTIEDIWTFSCQEAGFFNPGIRGALPEDENGDETGHINAGDLENGHETGHINAGGLGGFQRDYELQEVLGEAFQTEKDGHSWSSDEENVYLVRGLGPLAAEPAGWFGEGDDQQHLLEAVVNSLRNNSDETVSYWCDSSRSSVTSFADIAPSFQVQASYEGMAATTQDTANAFKECMTLSGHPGSFGMALTSPSLFESLASGSTEDKQPLEYPYGLHNENTAEVPRVRGKCRPKSSHRPRPRDRQLIQERLKELRELVPNGEKSSIDGLLDQTIKHMLFLKSVTEQAEKVKQFSDHELTANEKRETSSGHHSSTSWAMDVGDNPGSCPIIMKDLEHPGDILIQMLCNNEEVFFEMARVMHQLKLTILRGVMETHSEKWAHFIVQASTGFNRLDIFWPLMRILQRNGDWNLNQWCANV